MITIENMQQLADYYVQVMKNTMHIRIAKHTVQFPTAKKVKRKYSTPYGKVSKTYKQKACHFQYAIAHHHNNTPLICIRKSWFNRTTDIDKIDTLAHELAHIYAHSHRSKKFNDAYHFALILLSSYTTNINPC